MIWFDAMQTKDITDRTFRFALAIVNLSRKLERSQVGKVLAHQVLRSGTSVGANTEEAQAGQSKKDFLSKLAIARKEARETRYWLRLILEAQLANAEEVKPLIYEAEEILRVLTAIILSTQRGMNDRNS